MPQLDFTWFASQAFWVIVTFSAMFFIMWRFVMPLMRATVDFRKDRLEKDIKTIEEQKSEATRFIQEYESAMASASDTTKDILAKAHEEATVLMKQTEEDFNVRLMKHIEDGENAVLEAKEKAIISIHDIAEELTDKILRKVANVIISKDDIKTAVVFIAEKKE